MRTPVIAIVGRPNVGKSTLFNNTVGRQKAIVEDIPGVTRDRNYAFVERFDVPFYLVDTGGFERKGEGELADFVREQTKLAIDEADLIIALFDGKAGMQPGDEDVVELLRVVKKPVRYAVNKCDGVEQVSRVYDFYQLGIDPLTDLSALHGRGVQKFIEGILESLPDFAGLKELAERERSERQEREETARAELEEIRASGLGDEEGEGESFGEGIFESDDEFELGEEQENIEPEFAPVFLPAEGDERSEESELEYDREHKLLPYPERVERNKEKESEERSAEPERLERINVAIVGRPNVGKSTLLNTLLGEVRAIVSPVAGTTRDALDVELEKDGQKFVLVDTAGMRKKARVSDQVEEYSVMRSLSSVSNCDVALLLIDAIEGPTDQDAKIAGLVHDRGKGLILVVNKWDAVEKDHKTVHEFKQSVRQTFKFAPYASIVFTVAKSGRRCERLLGEAARIALIRHRRISTGKLNRVLRKELRRVTAPAYRGQAVKLHYANQVDIAPPRFLLFFDQPKGVHFSYLRALKNILREQFGFVGTDIKLETRKE